jgi:enoyl-CoA hydratase
MRKEVLLETEDGIATITLNRPARHNAINQALLCGLYDAVETVARRDDIRVAVLTGSGKSFCSGLDLAVLTSENLFDPRGDGADLPEVFAACPKPLIAAVNGHAITGGLEMALNCDFIIASERAVFIDSHALVGIHPGWGMSQLLQQAVGLRRAKQISFTGRPVPARQAFDWGLANEVLPHGKLGEGTRSIAAGICEADAGMIRTLKPLMEYRLTTTLDQALAKERAGFDRFLRRARESWPPGTGADG